MKKILLILFLVLLVGCSTNVVDKLSDEELQLQAQAIAEDEGVDSGEAKDMVGMGYWTYFWCTDSMVERFMM